MEVYKHKFKLSNVVILGFAIIIKTYFKDTCKILKKKQNKKTSFSRLPK